MTNKKEANKIYRCNLCKDHGCDDCYLYDDVHIPVRTEIREKYMKKGIITPKYIRDGNKKPLIKLCLDFLENRDTEND